MPVETVSIAQETRRRYLNYALSVITSRALPDVRDGLKPVQRRILFTMWHDLRLHFDTKPAKSARIVGDVTGKYHPHSDDAAYDALVRLAQDWVMRVPLVHPQGNFGSVDGDPPAARRYTEARLTLIADRLLAELTQRTVEMRPTYDNDREEPVVLPAQFPNILVNGASGIAVGLATNIPPHNLGEVLRACIFLIDNPDATTAVLMERVKGPDFPLGGKILADRAALRKIYDEGSGTIRVQAEWEFEGEGKRPQIIVTSIPYGVDKGKLENDIGTIIEERKLPQLLGLTNESNQKEGLRIALELKPDADPAIVMAYLYRHTALQDTFAYNLTCLIPGPNGQPRPERLGLKAILRHFLDFRLQTVRNRFQFELEQLRRRIHILDGFRIIFNALDEALKLIRESSGKADAAEKLIERFKLDREQADAVLDAQIYKIAQLEIRKILDELKEKRKAAKEIEEILASEKKLWSLVQGELAALEEKFGTRRKTKMANEEDVLEFDEEAYIVRENTNVVLTRDGWIKRVGRLASVETTRVREGDAVIAVVPASTIDHVVFLADDGTAYTLRVNVVPASSGYGEPVTKFFKLGDGVKVINAATTDPRFTAADGKHGPYLLSVTQQGMTLRLPLTSFREESTKSGRRYIKLSEGDKVVLATVPGDETGLILASERSHVLHFKLDEVAVLQSAGKGVIGINLDDGDRCLGGALLGSRFDALVVETSGGHTKKFQREAHRLVKRGGKGTEVLKQAGLARVVPPPIMLVDWEALEGKGEPKRNGNGNGHVGPKLFE